MSSKCWQETLKALLTQTNKRLAIVGIGQTLRGDDAVGTAIVRQLQRACPVNAALLLLDAGSAPENCTSKLRRFAPDIVLFIDAAALDATAGSIQMLELHEISAALASTHTISLRLIADYLRAELDCTVLLLAIQPLTTTLDAPLSPPLQASLNAIMNCILTSLKQS
jgi:hydrogenase 3 maturation protease